MKSLKSLPILGSVINQAYAVKESLYRSRYPIISRDSFINDIRTAIENQNGYASAKLGGSQQRWMYYEILLKKNYRPERIADFEKELIFHGFHQVGIFPAEPKFYLDYNKFYIEHVKNLDSIGIFYYPWELEIFNYYKIDTKLMWYTDQHPGRAIPDDPDDCYLHLFKGKKLLLISPFAHLLKQQATRDRFEGVWSKTGKRWFYPAQVDSLEFAYGFEQETQKRYPTAIDLFMEISENIRNKDFDIALISAAGLAVPIASYVKSLGKVGIDLGGHQQVVFGVKGSRWKESRSEDWKGKYFNDYWIDMPDHYKPTVTGVCDSGAYW